MSEVVIRCDASPRVGLGHLTRSIALAQAFRENCGVDATLLMRRDEMALGLARSAGVLVSIVPMSGTGSDAAVQAALVGAKALVLDYRGDLDTRTLVDASDRGIIIATIDDPTPRRLLADLAFYPPIPQVLEWDWTEFRGELLAGWEWVVLRRDLGSPRVDRIAQPPRLLISLGGSDPHDMSSVVLDALSRVASPCQPLLVIGPGNPNRQTVRARAESKEVRCVDSPANFADLIRNADIAVVSFGVTAYELAACRVPALYLCLTDDHAKSACVFERAGVARVMGTYPAISIDRTAESIQDAFSAYLDPGSWLHELPHLLDVAGAARVANRITAEMRGPRA